MGRTNITLLLILLVTEECIIGLDGMISRIEEFAAKGVDMADIGGESTRPGSEYIDESRKS